METIHQIIREAEQNYLDRDTKMGKFVNWSMHDTIERIDAYLNSRHISGLQDSLGRDKPFFNIVSAAVNIWYRATDIDRKHIKFMPTKKSAVVLAFIANVILQNWMVSFVPTHCAAPRVQTANGTTTFRCCLPITLPMRQAPVSSIPRPATALTTTT